MKTTRGAGTTAKHAGTAKHAATKKHAPAKTKAKKVTHKKATVHAKTKPATHAKAKGLALGEMVACCTTEALAASLRSQGLAVTDEQVLGLFRAAGGDDERGMPIRDALEAASEFGLAGAYPRWMPVTEPLCACGFIGTGHPGLSVHEGIGCAAEEARGVAAREDAPHASLAGPVGAQFGLTSAHGLILGLELPGPHAVLATPDGWWSWGAALLPVRVRRRGDRRGLGGDLGMTNCLITRRFPVEFTSGTAKPCRAMRPLTHSLDLGEEGLAMDASNASKGANHYPDCTCTWCLKVKGTHGGSGTPEYELWKEIRRKCRNPKRHNYSYYGGRGIAVCERWNGSFEDFLADVGHRPGPEYSLDRKDNNAGYWCGLCDECVRFGRAANWRWATKSEQAKNRRSTRLLTFNGKTQCLGDWAAEIGMTRDALRRRLDGAGMSVEEALTRPRNNRGKQAK